MAAGGIFLTILFIIAIIVIAYLVWLVWRNKQKDKFPDPHEQDTWVTTTFQVPGGCGFGGDVGQYANIVVKGKVCSVNYMTETADVFWTDIWDQDDSFLHYSREEQEKSDPKWGDAVLGNCNKDPTFDWSSCPNGNGGELTANIQSTNIPYSELIVVEELWTYS